MQLHNKTFIDWFHNRVICEELKGVSETIKWLAFGPREDVYRYKRYCNRLKFLNLNLPINYAEISFRIPNPLVI